MKNRRNYPTILRNVSTMLKGTTGQCTMSVHCSVGSSVLKNALYLIQIDRLSLSIILTNEKALYQLQSQTLSYPIARYQLLGYRIAHVF